MKKIVKIVSLICIILTVTACDGQKILTPSTLDPAITSFVTTYFPQSTITSAIYEDHEYDLLLSDGVKLEFDKKFNWKEIDCEHSTIYQEVPNVLVPPAIKNYVTSNYSQNRIVKISQDRDGWSVDLDNKIEIEFDKTFKVREIDLG